MLVCREAGLVFPAWLGGSGVFTPGKGKVCTDERAGLSVMRGASGISQAVMSGPGSGSQTHVYTR